MTNNVANQQAVFVPFYLQKSECRHCGENVVMPWHEYCTACGKQVNEYGPVYTELDLPKEHRCLAIEHALNDIHVGSPFCCFCGTLTASVRRR